MATHFDRVGDGGLFSSVEDLLLWDRNFYDNKLPGGADFINGLHMVGTLNDGEKIDYAFALIAADFKGLKMISHGGSFNGYRAELIRFPEQKFSVACLCNLGNINSTGLATKVAEIFLEKHLKQPNDGQPAESAFVTLSEQELTIVAGLYFNPVTETFRRIVAKDGKLSYVRGPGNESELKALDARRFLMVGTPTRAEVSFKASHLGKEKNMYVVTGTGKPEVFEPVKQVAYTPDELSKFAAVFYSEELDARYNLSIKEGKLIVSVGAEELLLEVLSPDTFASPQGIVVRFRRDQQNRISGFSLSSSRVKGIVFNKL